MNDENIIEPISEVLEDEEVSTNSSHEVNHNPLWLGLRLFFVDSGISVCLGFIIGFSVGFVGGDTIGLVTSPLLPLIGAIVSVYASFTLYRYFTKEVSALGVMLSAGVFTALSPSAGVYGTTLYLLIAMTLLAQLGGWTLAQKTDIHMPLVGRGWIKAFTIIGGISVFLTILGYASFLIDT